MACMTKIARISLAASGRKSTLKAVSLRLLLATGYLYDIGKIACEAIDNGEVKSVVKISLECCEMDMVRYAKDIICFFEASTNLFRHLTRLFPHNARFDELRMHRPLNSCEQLQHLVLNNCDTGDQSVLKIDMPNSKITCLKLFSCCFEKVQFLCLSKLSELHYELYIRGRTKQRP
ncbi:putative F-box/LRR-repeat protein [Panicum miliaceum]|uniref:F-box/LRR-repeat protein n=1 Tax=Panicum miliaceum TaxID=4540 RepID=A0A3L6TKK4_PANMI|nr:putative F-box/LRR-repeat protein [Panicum miliaceum]